MPNKLLYFSVYELVNLSFWNNNLICTLQFRDVGFLVEISISSSIVCYYCFYYFDSFYKLCFSLGEKITIWFHFDMSAMLLENFANAKGHFLISRILLHCSSTLTLLIKLALNTTPPSKYFLLQVHNRGTESTVHVTFFITNIKTSSHY